VEVRGRDEIVAYLVRSAGAAGEVDIVVHDVAYSGAEIYLRWDMRFTNEKGSREVVAPGVSICGSMAKAWLSSTATTGTRRVRSPSSCR